ncbi:hypothetical protein V3C99_000996 [Haemonchus contortus]|nr:unnamed protein product [Haemonchus contortus]
MLFKTLIFVAIACILIHQTEAQWYGYAGYPAYTGYASYYPTYAGYYGGLYGGLSYPTYGYYGWGSNKGGAPETPVAVGSLTNNLRQ